MQARPAEAGSRQTSRIAEPSLKPSSPFPWTRHDDVSWSASAPRRGKGVSRAYGREACPFGGSRCLRLARSRRQGRGNREVFGREQDDVAYSPADDERSSGNLHRSTSNDYNEGPSPDTGHCHAHDNHVVYGPSSVHQVLANDLYFRRMSKYILVRDSVEPIGPCYGSLLRKVQISG